MKSEPALACPADPVGDRAVAFGRRRRLVALIGGLGVGICLALAFATQGTDVERHTEAHDAEPLVRSNEARDPGPITGEPGADSEPTMTSPPPGSRRTRPLRVRVVGEGVAIDGAVVRVVTFDRDAKTATPRSAAVRTGADGVADLAVDEREADVAWLEIAAATRQGLRHGYRPLTHASRNGEWEIAFPRAGRLEIRVEGLPADKLPGYVDVRFLTPDGGWEALFDDLPATPVEDGGLFESHAIPRVQRVRLRPDGTGEVPEVPGDHGIYLEFPDNPEGWLVEKTEFSGCSMPSTPGEVCRVVEGTIGVYRARYRRAPSVSVRVEDEQGRPVPGAEVAVGVRQEGGASISRVFDTTSSTPVTGNVELPLWTGSRLPDWSPAGLVIVAFAEGRTSRVIETEGGWYDQRATIRLDPARTGVFVLHGTMRHGTGTIAAGIPVRVGAAPPWNGDSALPPLRATTDADGAWRIEVPESYRPVFAYGRRMRLEVDGERLDAQPRQAMWRNRYPDLPRATTDPESLDVPPPGSTTRHDVKIVLPRS